ncbi:hypothetical protein J1614_012162 [Plenodomus biglobosus]|nr:hypothetical protein J1614_012162 [Plenodomus biglobosus]
MAETRQTRSMTASASSGPYSQPTLHEFRIGEEEQDASELSDFDSDQSVRSNSGNQSQSPERKEGKRTKSMKKRERKKVGALTDGLDMLLGSAFTAEEVLAQGNLDADGCVDGVEEMEVENRERGPKKMNKRTRQNLIKMQQRREQRLANTQTGLMLGTHQQSSNLMPRKPLNAKKKATDARRARKERARLSKKVEQGERMDIG